jgi:hypothetical protein
VDGTSPEAVVTDVLSSAGAGSPTPYTINPPITTISNNGWLVSTGATATWTAHSGTNQRQTTPGPISAYLADSGPLSPAGSYTVTVDTNFNGGQNLASITAALKPAVAGGGSNRMLLGVGQ